jgi:hypothetical protein
MWCQRVDWIKVAWNRKECRVALNTVINFGVSQKAANFVATFPTVSYSRNTLFHGIG